MYIFEVQLFRQRRYKLLRSGERLCGIVGAIGDEMAGILFQSQRLEYAVSSGIVDTGDALDQRRAVGKLKNLAEVLKSSPLAGSIGIGHTRWATHGGLQRPTPIPS